ncbi:MAG: hypothetical protein COU11_02030 [Candidatus Harrisonbacteria bacterium CG10_big_fil_rev_8_21_14_0_10_49_15]|uniref:Uncharacterized protein n=1 Tax=Candidatus Harrisonbacteria bacterium CG10_big_fil_rev_8_21_14_0_10_49_15 TaxID=1974587 RepID=A0A2H0UL77_9BACT|nr:MAG: hypothetical protein COU11_02030 [Candidatus Harrisonbacteria bacterium CG10_big_fil_rev_8_21_14_0_10_49_15]
METALQALRSWFSNSGEVVVGELHGDCLRITRLAVGDEGRAVIKAAVSFTGPLDFALAQKQFQKIRGGKKKKFILTFGSSHATTLYTTLNLARENPSAVIDEAELDNLISQAMWKFVDRERPRIADKMAVSDLDVVLADVHVRGIRIDGYKVLNPIGFTAKNIGIAFRQTFLTRAASEFVRATFPGDRVELIGEAGAIAANVSAIHNDTDLMVARVARATTELFVARGRGCSYWSTLAWGSENLVAYLAAEIGVSKTTAEAIMTRYFEGATSSVFQKRLEHILNNELFLLMKKITAAAKRAKVSKAFIHAPEAFPVDLIQGAPRGLPHCPDFQRFRDVLTQQERTDNLSPVEGRSTAAAAEMMPLYLREWQAAPVYEPLERLVRRRVQWLMPIGTRE